MNGMPLFVLQVGVQNAGGMTHRMMILVIQVGVILFAARLGGMLAGKLRLPGVVGELLAGVLLGPYMLGGLPLPGFEHGLFHVAQAVAQGNFPISPELYGVCAIASVVLLFMVGLETDIKLFMRYSLAGTLVGAGGVTISFFLGDVMAMAFSRLLFGEARGFFDPSCLLLGVISTATSVGITARVLSEQRKLESPEGMTILAGAVVDDVLGIILLAVGMGIITASRGSERINWVRTGLIAVKAVGVWIAATAIGLVASRKISLLLKWFGSRSSIAILGLGLAMILAGLFEKAGLAMIIGAYVMGLSLSRTDVNQVVRETLHPIYAFLVPIFFTVMGMLVDVRVLASPDVLLFGALYTLVSAVAKMAGCGLPALSCGFNWRGALRIGAGMLPRGEVTLIIAGIGLAAELLDPKIFGVVIMMTLIASVVAPPVLVRLFRDPRSGLRKPAPADRSEELRFAFPSSDAADLLVNKLHSAFTREGFFVHTLDHRERLYQLRKDEVVIGFQQKGCEIAFDCSEGEASFLSAAMYEVLAELEQTVRELRKPIDFAAIGRRLQKPARSAARGPALADYLSVDALCPHLAAQTKEQVIDELLELVARTGNVTDRDEAKHAVWQREESMSTGMQFGIAIPHGRTDAVQKLVCAVGLRPEGIDFSALDGQPSRIFVLTLSPKSAAAPHVGFMAMISQTLNEQGRMALLSCETAKEMHAVLTGKRQPAARPTPANAFSWVRKLGPKKAPPALSQYLSRDCLAVRLEGNGKEEVLDELLGLLERRGLLRDGAEARNAIFEREAQMSTGMEKGVAIPHARTDAVDHLVCAVGLKPEGIDFGALDDQPSRIFVLSLSPKNAPAPHVQFMAMISRALGSDEGRDCVLSATTADALWVALLGQGSNGATEQRSTSNSQV